MKLYDLLESARTLVDQVKTKQAQNGCARYTIQIESDQKDLPY